jgi:1-phosphatidylinositol phosphodiesterase
MEELSTQLKSLLHETFHHPAASPSPATTATTQKAWIARGTDSDGYVQSFAQGQTLSAPAIATHRGSIWCLWSDPANELFYAIGNNSVFKERMPFPGIDGNPEQGIPVMAELLGMLHAIIVRRNGEVAHYIFDDVNRNWTVQPPLNAALGFETSTTPALVSFHNRLFLVFLQNQSLFFSTWTWNTRDDTAVWSVPEELSGISRLGGIPAMFVLQGKLHVLCSSTEGNREILGFAYSTEESLWNSCDDVSEGKSAVGVSATSYGDSAFLAFMENGPDDTSHEIFVSEFKDGVWRPHESVAGQTCSNPPQLTMLNGRINCIFDSVDDGNDLRWYSRSLLDYSLSTWMKDIPDRTLLSNITIPGTHDSCAESNIPFVRTQYLSITKQMEAGLRFLDLRCRVHDDGQIYMYHGGIPIDFPNYLKLDTVMWEVFNFMQRDGPPTETVLISINNDDTSNKEPHAVFYRVLEDYISKTAPYENGEARWITARTTKTLGEARGKCVLLRRFQSNPLIGTDERIGIDLSGWLNNNPDFTLNTPDGVTITLQDKWQYAEIIPLADLIQNKFTFVSTMLEKAAASHAEEWFLNFTSCVGVPTKTGEVAESHWIAVGAHSDVIGKFVPGMNVVVRRDFKWDIRRRYGVIAMDYPELPKDSDLISWLIGTNF